MTPTMFEINVAIVMVVVTVALFAWFRIDLAAGSAGRMARMMRRVGLDPRIVRDGDPRTRSYMKAARRRCRRCPNEDQCERWLAGKGEGDALFCPNARIFQVLRGKGFFDEPTGALIDM